MNWSGQWTTTILGSMSVCGCNGKNEQILNEDIIYVMADPIWDNDDAQTKCPIICNRVGAAWGGQWKATIPNKMSVCGCILQN